MTRKDYQLIATALQDAYRFADDTANGPASYGVDIAARKLATALGDDNPRFDRERFLEAAALDPAERKHT